MKRELDERYSYDFERSFNYIWEQIILPTINLVFNDIDEEFRSNAKLTRSYQDLSEYKNDIKEFYREKREWLKEVYLPHEKHPILDEHKLGALWCRTMLAYKPFYFNIDAAEDYIQKHFSTFGTDVSEDNERSFNNSEWFVKNIYCNYRVAFLVSVGIVYLYLLYDCKENAERTDCYFHDAYSYFWEKEVMRCPATTPTHSDFEISCIIALQKNDVLERDFDYLTYAIMLFQLEHYNKMCYYMQKHGVSIDVV